MIGERIKESREKNSLTQSGLAKKLNISRSAVNAWEMGISIPSAQYLIELSKLFKVSVDYLLELDNKELVDISSLSQSEKKMIYTLLSYFQKYGATMRKVTKQIENNYNIIQKTADEAPEKAIKEILEEIILMKDL